MTQEKDDGVTSSSLEEATTSYDSSLDAALEILQNLTLNFDGDGKVENSRSKSTPRYYSCQWKDNRRKYEYSRYRWRPYEVPRKSKASNPMYNIVDLLKRIQWRDDVDVSSLKYSLVDRLDIPCSIEATRPRTPDLEIEELSEYFVHFVRVGLKMSALAESMYC